MEESDMGADGNGAPEGIRNKVGGIGSKGWNRHFLIKGGGCEFLGQDIFDYRLALLSSFPTKPYQGIAQGLKECPVCNRALHNCQRPICGNDLDMAGSLVVTDEYVVE